MTIEKDLKQFPIYGLSQEGELIDIPVTSTSDYNHLTHQIHHFIKQQNWKNNKDWFIQRGIQQKLILLPVHVHEQVHLQAVKNLTDTEFLEKYKISRWELLFNRRHSEY